MMLTRRTGLIATLCALIAMQTQAGAKDMTDWIAEAGNDPDTTVMVVKRLSDGETWTNNAARAAERFRPASTSKIPHTLVALETGYAMPNTAFEWDGKARWLDEWNQDQTLETAYRRSVVWVYQKIAQDHGRAEMAKWIKAFDYGNADTGDEGDLTTYWLRGPLEITANEQVTFLEKLARRELPLSPATYTAAKVIMLEDAGEDWALYAKTGWNLREGQPDIGWFVGWVEAGQETYVFALNMDMAGAEDAPRRRAVARDVLAKMDILPPAR